MVPPYEGKRDRGGILMSRRALQKTNIGSPETQYLSPSQENKCGKEEILVNSLPQMSKWMESCRKNLKFAKLPFDPNLLERGFRIFNFLKNKSTVQSLFRKWKRWLGCQKMGGSGGITICDKMLWILYLMQSINLLKKKLATSVNKCICISCKTCARKEMHFALKSNFDTSSIWNSRPTFNS